MTCLVRAEESCKGLPGGAFHVVRVFEAIRQDERSQNEARGRHGR